MSSEELAPINEQDFKDLKERMKLIVEADPKQYHNDFSLRRYLRAFKTTDDAFQAILKTAIRVLLDDNTAKKVKFVGDEVELCQYLIPDILPTDM
nr:LOW QUALITY PROTEIN: uncharacterized protein LOC108007104 [Drosophila suzukii]